MKVREDAAKSYNNFVVIIIADIFVVKAKQRSHEPGGVSVSRRLRTTV
jgi:hypothetical protein